MSDFDGKKSGMLGGVRGIDGSDHEPVDVDDSEAPPAAPPGDTQSMVGSVGPTHVLAPRFSVVVVSGADAGLRHASTGDRVVIGTHPSADMVLHDPTVS